jgi:hypothetical protein
MVPSNMFTDDTSLLALKVDAQITQDPACNSQNHNLKLFSTVNIFSLFFTSSDNLSNGAKWFGSVFLARQPG